MSRSSARHVGTPTRRSHRRRRGPEDGDVDPVRIYLDEIHQRPLLDRAGEARLGKAVQAGRTAAARLAQDGVLSPDERHELTRQVAEGERATQEFAEANLRLVVSVASRYRRPAVDLLDLVQAGNIGLLRAVQRFDWRLGNRFSTYAIWWIRQAVLEEAGGTSRTIRLPLQLRQELNRLARAREGLRAELGHEPSVGEVAAMLAMPRARVRELLSMSQDLVSLSRTVGDYESTELSDLLADPVAADPAETAALVAERQEVRRLLDQLGDRQRLSCACGSGWTGLTRCRWTTLAERWGSRESASARSRFGRYRRCGATPRRAKRVWPADGPQAPAPGGAG